jgi:hypothetical protein
VTGLTGTVNGTVGSWRARRPPRSPGATSTVVTTVTGHHRHPSKTTANGLANTGTTAAVTGVTGSALATVSGVTGTVAGVTGTTAATISGVELARSAAPSPGREHGNRHRRRA